MKTCIITSIVLLYSGFLVAQNINPKWKSVGPISLSLQSSDWCANINKIAQIKQLQIQKLVHLEL